MYKILSYYILNSMSKWLGVSVLHALQSNARLPTFNVKWKSTQRYYVAYLQKMSFCNVDCSTFIFWLQPGKISTCKLLLCFSKYTYKNKKANKNKTCWTNTKHHNFSALRLCHNICPVSIYVCVMCLLMQGFLYVYNLKTGFKKTVKLDICLKQPVSVKIPVPHIYGHKILTPICHSHCGLSNL